MMEIEKAIQYLQLNVNRNKKLISYFEKEGFDIAKALSVEDGFDDGGIYKGDGELYLENTNSGFCFLLRTENSLYKKNHHLPIVEGDWVFTTIFLYSEGKDEYKQFQGVLPYDISFGETEDTMKKKIGVEPDLVNNFIRKWDNLNGIELSLSSIEENKPKVIIVSKFVL